MRRANPGCAKPPGFLSSVGAKGEAMKKNRTGFWPFVLPSTLVFAAIVLVPFLIGIYYSMTEWNGIDKTAIWTGLQNYRAIFQDADAFQSLWFTVRFTAVVVVVSNALALVLALGLIEPIKGSGILRVVFFLPNVIGGLILGFIWRFVYTQGFPSVGKLTGAALFLLPWLGNAPTGFWGLVIVYVWKTTGYLVVIYLAALLSVDRSLLESAQMDGAGYFARLLHIQLPMIMPAFTVCIFLMLSWAFKIFDVVYSLTNGGPYRSTEVFALNIYNEAFVYNNYGYGSAKAVLFFVLVAILSLIQVYFSKRREIEL